MKTKLFRSLVAAMTISCSVLLGLTGSSECVEAIQRSPKGESTDPVSREPATESVQISAKAIQALIAVAKDEKSDLNVRITAIKSLEAWLSKAENGAAKLTLVELLKPAKGTEYNPLWPALLTGLVVFLIQEWFKSRLSARLENIKSDLGGKFHVRSARYNKEFDVLGQLWATCICLKHKMIHLHSQIGTVDDTEKERIISDIREIHGELSKKLDECQPFFDEELYDLITDLNLATQKELHELEDFTKRATDKNYSDNLTAGAEQTSKLFDKSAHSIRERIKKLDNGEEIYQRGWQRRLIARFWRPLARDAS